MNGWFYAKCRKYLDPDVSEEAQIAEPNSRCPTSTRTVLPTRHHQFPYPQVAKQKCSWNRRLRRFGQKNPLSSTSVDRAFTRLIFSDFPVLFAPGRHFPLNSSPTEQSRSSKPPGGLQPHLRLFLASLDFKCSTRSAVRPVGLPAFRTMPSPPAEASGSPGRRDPRDRYPA
jgi:hypothetical protein